MHETRDRACLSVDMEGVADASFPGIVVGLGALHPTTIITEEGVARLFCRHIVSVKRAVERGELPPPCNLFGSKVWTAGILIRHIERRLEQAAKESERDAKRTNNLSPRG